MALINLDSIVVTPSASVAKNRRVVSVEQKAPVNLNEVAGFDLSQILGVSALKGKPGPKPKESASTITKNITIDEIFARLNSAQHKAHYLVGRLLSLKPQVKQDLCKASSLTKFEALKCWESSLKYQIRFLKNEVEASSFVSFTSDPWALHGKSLAGRPAKAEQEPYSDRVIKFWATINSEISPDYFATNPQHTTNNLTNLANALIGNRGLWTKGQEYFELTESQRLSILESMTDESKHLEFKAPYNSGKEMLQFKNEVYGIESE